MAPEKPVLVTGAAGFLGNRLARDLLATGRTVRVVVRKEAAARDLEKLGLQTVVGDLTHTAVWTSALRGVEDVYNCAGKVSDWGTRAEFEAGNVATVAALLQAAEGSPLRRVVHVSSTDVYGYTGEGEDETARLRATGIPYGDTKIRGEQLLATAAANGLSVKIVRPSSIYGPGSQSLVTDVLEIVRWPLVPLFGLDVCAGLIEVSDVAAAMQSAMRESSPSFQAYNVCGEEPVTWRSYMIGLATCVDAAPHFVTVPTPLARGLADLSEAITNPLRVRPPLTRLMIALTSRSQMFPIGKALSRLDFKPRVPWEMGLERIRTWLGRSRESQACAIPPMATLP
jgi:nucleoside-diphosphate-sugar epimerase